MKTKKQYLIIDTKKSRRHSAPENLGTWPVSRHSSQDQLEKEYWCRASVSDFSVLLENQSESGSSLELDTSNLSRDLSPIPTTKSSPRGSYQILPVIDNGHQRGSVEEFLRHGLGTWSIWKDIILCQAIAGCLTFMEVSNDSLRERSQNVVTNGQNLPHYIFLSVLWTTKLALRNDGRDFIEIIKLSGLRYLFLSILHVEANYLLLSSFHHSSCLGNQVVDCVAASLSLLVAFVCLEVQFHWVHVFGFVCTLLGSVGLGIANVVFKNHNQDVLLGDILRMASGLCLAFNSVAQEIIVKSIDFVEYLGMIGLIGSIICGFHVDVSSCRQICSKPKSASVLQDDKELLMRAMSSKKFLNSSTKKLVLEPNRITPTNLGYWFNVLTYSSAQFFFNSLTPIVLRDMGATGLHLALITSGFYTYFIGVICERDKLEVLYLLSYVVALLGTSLFTVKRTSFGTHYFFPVKVVISKGG